MHKSQMNDLILKCLKDPQLLERLKKDPKNLIEKELNIKLPASYQLEVVQETSQKGYIVIPFLEKTDEYSAEELKEIAGGGRGPVGTAYRRPC